MHSAPNNEMEQHSTSVFIHLTEIYGVPTPCLIVLRAGDTK